MLTVSLAPMMIGFMVVGFLIVSLLMILIVLIQRPQGGGLSEAFGSNSGSGHTAFGAKTGDALTTATIGIFVLFIVAAIVLNFATRPGVATAQTSATETPANQQPQQPAPSSETVQAPSETGDVIEGEGFKIQKIDDPTASGEVTIVEPSLEEPTADDTTTDEPAGDEPSTEEPSAEDNPQ